MFCLKMNAKDTVTVDDVAAPFDLTYSTTQMRNVAETKPKDLLEESTNSDDEKNASENVSASITYATLIKC